MLMVLAGTWVSLSPCARIWALIAFFADCRASTMTAWRYLSIFSATRFGDRLRIAITIPLVMSLWLGQPGRRCVLAGRFHLHNEFITTSNNDHIKSNSRARLCLLFVCCL